MKFKSPQKLGRILDWLIASFLPLRLAKCVLFLVLLGTPLIAADQPDTNALHRQIKQKQKEIEDMQTSIQKEDTRSRKYRIHTEQRMAAKRKAQNTVDTQRDSLDRLLKKRLARRQFLRRKTKEMDLLFAAFNQVIRQKAVALREMIQSGFPFETEKRAAPLDLLVRDIDQLDLSPEEAFNRFWIICDTEQKLGGDCEIASTDITLPQGQTIPVRMLRLGKQFLAYAAIESDQYGLLNIQRKDNQYVYEWQHQGLSFDTRRAIKAAIQVKEGKKPPQLVVLPISRTLDPSEVSHDN